jgi:hypothetical protein
VDYATANDTAVAPDDYATTTGILTFAPGQTTKTVDVPVKGETDAELTETFSLDLSAPSHVNIVGGHGVGTITDNDPDPNVSINDVTLDEGDAGTSQATFTVSLTGATFKTVTVNYATANDTATDPADYAATSGGLTFGPGETTKQVSVDVQGDVLDEANETFTVGLSNAVNANISAGGGIGTITDDDRATTSMVVKAKKTKAGLTATGTLLNAEAGMKVTVKLQKQRGKHFVKGLSRTAKVKSIVDSNGDNVFEGRFSTKFKRPAKGAYRFLVTYAGDADHLPSVAARKFKV